MQLTGTEEERIVAAIAFAKAHRSHEYERDKIAEVYRKAGVPFTPAAEKFCREWDGVFDRVNMYPDRPNVVMDDGTHYLIDIDFSFNLLSNSEHVHDPVDNVKVWYDADYMRRDGDGCSKRCAESIEYIRQDYGADTVPVAAGGWYYPDIVCVCPDGKIVAYLPEEGNDQVFGNLEEFLHLHIGGHGLSRIEVVRDEEKLEGTMDERIAAAIAFAKAHGGFEHCRLFAEMYNRAPLDLSRIREQENRTGGSASGTGSSDGNSADNSIAALLLEILEEATPNWYHETTLPCKIEFVDE